ncbi:MAG: site-2 protease family protein [Candidatus Kerfeldbacteria bacterium]|nr:site-2 protease family protein [Candidatus Kerfeldbacteria bacterium]
MAMLLFVLILSLLVFVHESGHFIAARKSGVVVDEFGFGFPPRLFSFRSHATLWSLNLIPFGGFVRLKGERNDDAAQPGSFATAGVGKRMIILAAGVLMNYLLAWLIFSLVLVHGTRVDQSQVPSDRWHRWTGAETEAIVAAGSPAAKAGLAEREPIISINGQALDSTEQVIDFAKKNGYPTLSIRTSRQGQERTITITPSRINAATPHYGFGLERVGTLAYPWYVAPWYGGATTISLSWQTIKGLAGIVGQLVAHGRVSGEVTGPVGIAVLTGQVRHLGWATTAQFVGVLSLSLAVINFLPIPALDGGRAAFVLFEHLRGKRVDPKIENVIHSVGFYMLVGLVVLISVRDVQRFGILQRLTTLFHS